MFNPDADAVKKGPWIAFIMVAFFGAFGSSGIPGYWWVYLFVVIVALGFVLYLVYFCERYTFYVSTLFLSLVGTLAFLFSSFAYLSASGTWGAASFEAVTIGLVPIVSVVLVYYAIVLTKSAHFPFECAGLKVALREVAKSQSAFSVGLIAGVTTLTGSIFLKSVDALTSEVVIVLVGSLGCLALLINFRHTIRGLRTLRIQERSMPIPYTFMRIDEIREARHRWWLGRFFKWIISLRESHD